MDSNPLDVWQRLACKFEDVCCRADKSDEKLWELFASNSASQWEKPLPHNEEDEDDLMESQDPDIGANRCKHACENLQREGWLKSHFDNKSNTVEEYVILAF